MSLKATVWALDMEGITQTQKLALLTLADHADKNLECYPSRSLIRKRCLVKTRGAVTKALKGLEEKGLIERSARVRKDGGSTSNLYRLLMFREAQPVLSDGSTPPCPQRAPQEEPLIRTSQENLKGLGVPKGKPEDIKDRLAPYQPPYLTERFFDALSDFLDHRKEIGKKMAPGSTAWKLLRKRLASWGEEAAATAIENAVSSGWQGVFEPKGAATRRGCSADPAAEDVKHWRSFEAREKFKAAKTDAQREAAREIERRAHA